MKIFKDFHFLNYMLTLFLKSIIKVLLKQTNEGNRKMLEQIIKDLENVLKNSDEEFTKEFVKWTHKHKSDLNDFKKYRKK